MQSGSTQAAHPELMQALDATWRNLVNDPAKLDGVVDAMARCMGKVLSLKNDEVDEGRSTLGHTLYDEKEHFPSREMLDEIENCHKAIAFVEGAHAVASGLRKECDASGNVVLTPWEKDATFCQSWTFTRPRGESESRLRVGGLRRSLFTELGGVIYAWLCECDETMMIAFGDTCKGERADEAPLYQTINDLSEAIARRLSLLEPRKHSDDPDDDLSTRVLQSRANEELSRTSLKAEESQRTDLIALRTLETLAREGPASAKGRAILETRLSHIDYVVRKPPLELGLNGINAQSMNLSLLARACNPDIDADVRHDLVSQWFEWHGGFASTAAGQAIQKIKVWQSTPQQPFIKVLQPPVGGAAPSQRPALSMPPMPFVWDSRVWKFVAQTDKRTNLDWVGRRVVRMTSMVLQLLAHGGLERGVIASCVASPIATQAVVEARLVLGLLAVKRDSYSLGTKLLKFCEDVSDTNSTISGDVSDAMLHVSKFSTIELLSIFSPQSPALRMIMNEFTMRTQSNLTFRMPEQYVAFAYDAMAILLPTIKARREAVGMPLAQKSSPICELLQRVPAALQWSPLHGCLKLELEDLKQAPPMLVPLLKELAQRKVLVEYKRPYLGKQRHAAKMAFVFDSAQLVEAMSGCALGGLASVRGPTE